MKKSVQVPNQNNVFVRIVLNDLDDRLNDCSSGLSVEHIFAVAEFGNEHYFPLIYRALESDDPGLIKAAAQVSVKLKMSSAIEHLRKKSKSLDSEKDRQRINAAINYLSYPDRGISRLGNDGRESYFLMLNLVSVVEFDDSDVKFAVHALEGLGSEIDENFSGGVDLWRGAVANVINGVPGAVVQGKLDKELKARVLISLNKLKEKPGFIGVHRCTKNEMKEIEKRIK
ncbi:MAG: HEAT repeat domain-containing protein [Leptospiraceae bacterium]|nr:HEAT repeat domain-containing protein [Leptospiraceae bacterium]